MKHQNHQNKEETVRCVIKANIHDLGTVILHILKTRGTVINVDIHDERRPETISMNVAWYSGGYECFAHTGYNYAEDDDVTIGILG